MLEKLNKYSTSIKDSELKIYNYAYTFFKEANLAIELENQAAKTNGKKLVLNYIAEEDSVISKSKNDKN